MKNRVSEVGQHSVRGPEATCMHPQNNNTPPFLFLSYHRRLFAAELMEGLALVKEHKGLDDLSAFRLSHKRQLPTNPGAAGKGSAHQGLFLKKEGTRRGGGFLEK